VLAKPKQSFVTGPKMYIAHASVEDNIHHGSTKLHIDMTDAVNIMVWASDRREQQQRYALWRIFPQAASPLICQFLRVHTGFSGPGHPIHSQSVYFTEDMLAELEARTGVRPFTIKQYTGEAIYIPAGCAHQVCCFVTSLSIPVVEVPS
jgi:lysine-specific demethylase 3